MMKRASSLIIAIALSAAAGASAAPDWSAVLKLQGAKQWDALLEKPYFERFRDFGKKDKQENILEFLALVHSKGDEKTIFNTFVKDGGSRQVKFGQRDAELRKPLIEAAKKASTPVNGKLPLNAWAKLDFKPLETAARSFFRTDSIKDFLVAMRNQEDIQKNNKVRLELGDIILYVDKGWFSGVAVSQGANRFFVPTSGFANYNGSIYTHHAAVVGEDSLWRLGVAHSGGANGVSFVLAKDGTGVGTGARLAGSDEKQVYGSYMVFRLKDPNTREQWADRVNAVAQAWTKGTSQRGEYAATKDLVAAGVNFSSYNGAAKDRMRWYVAHAKENGLAGQKLFCSQFVIAVYQAALGERSEELMPLAADYTTPMKLHHYLASNPKVWTLVGTEKY